MVLINLYNGKNIKYWMVLIKLLKLTFRLLKVDI